MHIRYTNKKMDVQRAWQYSLNRYYALKYTNKRMDVQKAWLYLLNRCYAYKVYKQIDGCTESLAMFTIPLLCI